MRNRPLTAIVLALGAAGCATGSSGPAPSGSGVPPAALDADCNPPEPSHTPECDRARTAAADIDDQIAALRQSLEGPPVPTGPERATINAHILGLERQRSSLGQRLAACRTQHPLRRTEAERNGDLDGTIAITVPEGSRMPPGTYSEPVHPSEVRIRFTANGCAATLTGLPASRLRGPAGGAGIVLSQPSSATGEYHPVSGRMTLSFRTRLDLAPSPGSGTLMPADAAVTLTFPGPLSPSRHVRLEGHGQVSGGDSDLHSIDVIFDGTLTALPAPQ